MKTVLGKILQNEVEISKRLGENECEEAYATGRNGCFGGGKIDTSRKTYFHVRGSAASLECRSSAACAGKFEEFGMGMTKICTQSCALCAMARSGS